MDEQRDNGESGDKRRSEEQILSGQQSQASEYGQQSDQTVSDGNEGESSVDQREGMSGQPIGGNDSNTGSGTTLTQAANFGRQSPSEDSSGEGFIGSKVEAGYLKENSGFPASTGSPSSAKATHGSNFANQGRGALDEEDTSEEDSGSR